MALSYTGLLFRRIVVTSGYTYGKNLRVSVVHLTNKYGSEYCNKLKVVYRRNKKGRWDYSYEPVIDRKTPFWDALNWLEDNGYIQISRNETVRVSRLCTGMDDFIKITEKGLAAAPQYLRQPDPYPKGHSDYDDLYE